MVTQEQINEIIRRIIENYHPEKIVLFGSYAYGNPTESSDLDLLIVKDSKLQRYKRGREVRKYLRSLKVAIDLIVYTKDEIQKWRDVKPAFITTIMEKGRVLYTITPQHLRCPRECYDC
ncbi:MAG: nucleotidyltransferase domain-containing protein, partial [bacterium]|nr:nucleotidyltransferase domain-containing protein [bacterium]